MSAFSPSPLGSDELSGILRDAVNAVRTEPIDERQVRDFLQRQRGVGQRDRAGRRRLIRISSLLGAAAAALLLVWIANWHPAGDNAAWADVVAAVRGKTWMRAQVKQARAGDPQAAADAEVALWYSGNLGVLALRAPGQAMYFDLKQGTVEVYQDQEVARVVRMTIDEIANEPLRTFSDMFAAFLIGDTDRTLLLGDRKLVHLNAKNIDESVAEHSFSWEDDLPEEQPWMVLRVDRAAKLPLSWQIKQPGATGRLDQLEVTEYVIDYPDHGPTSVYDLGVPQSTELIDRVPARDLAQVLDRITTEIRKFDDYAAVVVHSDGNAPWWQAMQVYRVWKQGDKWRIERSFGPLSVNRDTRPAEDADPLRWWIDRAKQLQFVPGQMYDGESGWRYNVQTRLNAAEQRMEVAAIEKTRQVLLGKDFRPDDQTAFPHFAGRSVLNTQSGDWQLRLDLTDKSGPAGTFLVEEKPRPGSKLATWATLRHWIDPERGYLTVRRDEVPAASQEITPKQLRDAAQNPQALAQAMRAIPRQTVLEAVEKTNTGHWYPTRVRQVNAAINQEGTPSDVVLRYYVQFDRPIPDELFEP